MNKCKVLSVDCVLVISLEITTRLAGSISLLYCCMCVCASLCLESRKGVTLYTTAITCLATPRELVYMINGVCDVCTCKCLRILVMRLWLLI